MDEMDFALFGFKKHNEQCFSLTSNIAVVAKKQFP